MSERRAWLDAHCLCQGRIQDMSSWTLVSGSPGGPGPSAVWTPWHAVPSVPLRLAYSIVCWVSQREGEGSRPSALMWLGSGPCASRAPGTVLLRGDSCISCWCIGFKECCLTNVFALFLYLILLTWCGVCFLGTCPAVKGVSKWPEHAPGTSSAWECIQSRGCCTGAQGRLCFSQG